MEVIKGIFMALIVVFGAGIVAAIVWALYFLSAMFIQSSGFSSSSK